MRQRAGLLVLTVALTACTRVNTVDVRLRLPAGAPSDLVFQVLVWPDGTACPSLADVVTGAATGFAIDPLTFTESSAMTIGRVPGERATVAVLARDRACAPVLFGCEAFELADGIDLALGAATWTGAPCPEGVACLEGACLPRPLRDAGPDAELPDAGPDATVDGGADGGADAGPPLACPADPELDGGAASGMAFDFREIAMGTPIATSFPVEPTERRTTDVELRDLDDDEDLDVTVVDRQGWWPHEAVSRIYLREGASWRDATSDVFAGITYGTDSTGDLSSQGISALWTTLTGSPRLDLVAGSYADRGAVLQNLGPVDPLLGYVPGFPEAEVLGECAAVGDLDGDGALDLILATSEETPRVWLNRIDSLSRFVDATDAWLGDLTSFFSATRPILLDLDQDGDLDLLLSITIAWINGTPAQWTASPLTARYFENDGARFVERSAIVAPHLLLDAPLALGDLDNDGDLDLVQVGKGFTVAGDGTPTVTDTSVPGEWRVLVNGADGPGAPSFTDVTTAAFPFGTPSPYGTHSPGETGAVGDFDGDGWLDVIVMRGEPRLLPNRGATSAGIQLLAEEPLPVAIGGGGRVAVGDLEPDGDVDLAVTEEYLAHGIRLFENQRGGARVVRVRIDDRTSANRFGVGAHVRVYRATGEEARGELVAYRHVLASTEQHLDYTQHVALPEDGCYEVEVTWPRVDGARRVERRRVVAAGAPQTLTFP